MASRAPEAGYGDLLRWACREVYPTIPPRRQAALISLAQQVRQHPALRTVECGLELHHDGSGRVDLGFHSQSRLLDLGGTALPGWWDALVQASDPPEAAELFGEAARELRVPARQAADRERPALRLSGWHFLEFDQSRDGPLRLAGLFQHCKAARPRDPLAWNQALDHFQGLGCIPDLDLRRSKALQRVFSAFGVPVQWGFMVGRSEGLKLVAVLGGSDARQLQAFCLQAGLQPTLGDHGDLTQWCKMVASPPRHLLFAISLDLDLARDTFAPVVGLEASGPRGPGGKTDAASTWAALGPLLERCAVEGAARASLRAALQPLPRGQRLQVHFGGLEDFLAEELQSRLRIAYHNHIKLVFRPGQPTAVKSYVALQLRKGVDTAGA